MTMVAEPPASRKGVRRPYLPLRRATLMDLALDTQAAQLAARDAVLKGDAATAIAPVLRAIAYLKDMLHELEAREMAAEAPVREAA